MVADPTKKGTQISRCQTTIITFDLHGVLFTHDWRRIFKIMWHSTHKRTVLSHIYRPSFLMTCFSLWRQKSPVEKYIMHLIATWPELMACKDELFAIANAQRPRPEMVDLAQRLHAQRYTLHIFSNIGSLLLADLIPQHPELFSLFSSLFTTSADLGYPSKHDPAFFAAYKASMNNTTKRIIFIDDSHKNLRTGTIFGMYGIHGKNMKHVQAALQHLGILD